MSNIELYREFSQVTNTIGLKSSLFHDENILIYSFDDFLDKPKGINTPPFRQDFYDISLFLDVAFQWKYAHGNYQIRSGSLQVVPIQQTQQIIVSREMVANSKGYTLYFKPDFITSVLQIKQFHSDFPFFSFSNSNPVFNLSKEELDEVLFLFQRIHYEFLKREKFTVEVIRGYLIALLNIIKRIHLNVQNNSNNNIRFVSRELNYVTEFQDLISSKVTEIQSVKDYADILCLSPKYLSEVLKNTTGKTALQHIHEMLILEAKNQLSNTELTIGQIAYQLNFSDTSNFIKFFKKHTGITPKRFKKPRITSSSSKFFFSDHSPKYLPFLPKF